MTAKYELRKAFDSMSYGFIDLCDYVTQTVTLSNLKHDLSKVS